MAAKKNASDDDEAMAVDVDAEAGLVPKGDSTADDIADASDADEAEDEAVGDYTDSIGEAVESVESDDPNAPPPPITPATPLEAAQGRILFENQINDGAAAFAEFARGQYIEAALAGKTIELSVVED